MLGKLINMFFAPSPVTPTTQLNNVLHIEHIRYRHFFNAIKRAIGASNLTRNNIERVMHNARDIWQKHKDAVPGYAVQRECEDMALAYLDKMVRFQRNDQKPAPIRLWATNSFDGAA